MLHRNVREEQLKHIVGTLQKHTPQLHGRRCWYMQVSSWYMSTSEPSHILHTHSINNSSSSYEEEKHNPHNKKIHSIRPLVHILPDNPWKNTHETHEACHVHSNPLVRSNPPSQGTSTHCTSLIAQGVLRLHHQPRWHHQITHDKRSTRQALRVCSCSGIVNLGRC